MRITISDEVAEVLFNALRKNIDCDCCPAYKNEDMCKRCTQGGYMPSVTQKSGKWIKVKSGDKDFPESIVCSRCGNENSHLDFNENAEPIGKVFVTSRFCPNCGAKMESEE